MRKYVYLMLTVMFVSILSACSSYNYYTAAANKTNLSNYHTFALAPVREKRGKHWRPLDEIGNGRIQEAAKQALIDKGLVMQANNPDLLVSYTTVTGRGTKMEYYSPYYGAWGYGYGWYRPYYYGFGWPGSYGYAQKVHYKEGTIIIDLIDTRTNDIVWRGYGVGELHNPKRTMNDVPKVVDGIIKQLQLTPDSK
ncbi:DUF4136 domain-containing protein [Mucilaginibacter segetis]|uniref:DUF4136 domain-containing protein n=1 Tax=Mucilaginibacter segetis TaxID=2793071 RepID=A0A934PW44_9SPHI|nr:DUF4136 domain-containing protein [Mucilaginibacter segetis]MBK0380490.1 DUF4136 domain-containing protein [Mucilaginibacter segetis]